MYLSRVSDVKSPSDCPDTLNCCAKMTAMSVGDHLSSQGNVDNETLEPPKGGGVVGRPFERAFGVLELTAVIIVGRAGLRW